MTNFTLFFFFFLYTGLGLSSGCNVDVPNNTLYDTISSATVVNSAWLMTDVPPPPVTLPPPPHLSLLHLADYWPPTQAHKTTCDTGPQSHTFFLIFLLIFSILLIFLLIFSISVTQATTTYIPDMTKYQTHSGTLLLCWVS